MSVRNSLKHGSKWMLYFHLVNAGGYFPFYCLTSLVFFLSRLCLNLKSKMVCMYHRFHTYIKVCSLLKMCVSALDLTLMSYLHFLVGVLLLHIMPEEREGPFYAGRLFTHTIWPSLLQKYPKFSTILAEFSRALLSFQLDYL